MRSLLISCIMAGLLLASTHAFADGATAKQERTLKPMIKTAMGNKGTVFTGTVMKEVHGSGDGKGKETKVVIYSHCNCG